MKSLPVCLSHLAVVLTLFGDTASLDSQTNKYKGFQYRPGSVKNMIGSKVNPNVKSSLDPSELCTWLESVQSLSDAQIQARVGGGMCGDLVRGMQSRTSPREREEDPAKKAHEEVGSRSGSTDEERVKLRISEQKLNATLEELQRSNAEKESCQVELVKKTQKLEASQFDGDRTKSDVDANVQHINKIELELAQTKSDLAEKVRELNISEFELTHIRSDLKKKLEKLDSTTLKLEEFKSALKTKAQDYDSMESKFAQSESKLAEKVYQLNVSRLELIQTKSDLKTQREELDSKTLELQRVNSSLNTKAAQIEVMELELVQAKADLAEKSEQLKTTNSELIVTKSELAGVENFLLNISGCELMCDNSDQQNQIDFTESKLAQINSTLAEREKQLNISEFELIKTKSDLDEKTKKLESMEAELMQTQSDLAEKVQQLNASELELIKTKSDLAEKVQQLNISKFDLLKTKSDLLTQGEELEFTLYQLEQVKTSLNVKDQKLKSMELKLSKTLSDVNTNKLESKEAKEKTLKTQTEPDVKPCTRVTERTLAYGNYNWTKSDPGSYLELPCAYNEDKNARKICSLMGEFEPTNFTLCNTHAAIAAIEDALAQGTKNLTTLTRVALSKDLSKITDELGGKFGTTDVKKVAKVIELIAGSSSGELTNDTMDNLVSTMDNVQIRTKSDALGSEGSKVVRESAVTVVSKLVEHPGTLRSGSSIGFGVADVSETKESRRKNALVLAGEANRINGSSNNAGNKSDVFFSAELTTATPEQVATAVYYASDKLFPSSAVPSTGDETFEKMAKAISGGVANKQHDSRENYLDEVSLVATVISDINIVDKSSSQISALEPNHSVAIQFKVLKDTELKVHSFIKRKQLVRSELTCKFYNTSEKDWSDEGCKTITDYDEYSRFTDVKCSCDHLTSFAVLMSMTSVQYTGEEEASHTLLAISLISLLLTLIAITPNKQLMKMQCTQVNLMLVLALTLSIICFFLMDLFVSADGNDEPSIPCSIIAFALNYLWLCQLSWMTIEAVSMYLAMVKVFNTYASRVMLKYSLAGWVLPLIFPIIGVAWGGKKFVDPKTCYVRRPYGFVSFYGPVVIGVTINWILFYFIARVVMKVSSDALTAKPKKSVVLSMKMRSRQLRSAIVVSIFLGLGWITGFFLLMNDSNYFEINTVLRWIFIAVNAPQGLFIFLFYVVLKEEVRRYWKYNIQYVKHLMGGEKGSLLLRSQTRSQLSTDFSDVASHRLSRAMSRSNFSQELAGLSKGDTDPKFRTNRPPQRSLRSTRSTIQLRTHVERERKLST